jgi:hypothetical protein
LSVKGCVADSDSANNIVSSYIFNNAKVNVKAMTIASVASYVFVCARANATDQAVANVIANGSRMGITRSVSVACVSGITSARAKAISVVNANANARDTATV